jgi:MFS family permease
MKFSPRNTTAALERARGAFLRLATGGDWALSQSDTTRRNLVWFWFDGFFASAADNIVLTYLVVYLVALGATQAQIGLMSSLSSLSAALLLLPGAMLVERVGNRRSLVLIGGGWARFALLLLAVLPLFLRDSALIFVAIALSISRDALANLSFPAWMSITGDVVPLEGRGRYFASRNFIMGVSGILMTFAAGQVISRIVQPGGYQLAIFAAFAIGIFSVISFSRLTDTARPLAFQQVKESVSPRALIGEMLQHREFATFAAITALWNFSLNIAGPFFTVYMVTQLNADAAMVGMTSIASSVAGMLAQRKLGELNDRWGARRLTVSAALLIPMLPWFWLFITQPWQIIPANLVGGVLWGAFNLASFNYLLMITPAARLARFSAMFQIIVTVSMALGAALGSILVTTYGYRTVFLTSGLGRLVAALLFAFTAYRAARAVAATRPANTHR